MALCPGCAAFDIQSFKTAPYQTRGYKFEDVERSARKHNCTLCNFLCSTALDGKSAAGREHRWIHLRMSENSNRRVRKGLLSSNTDPLRFNRLDVMLAGRHALFTDEKSGESSWKVDGVQCRILADPESNAFKSGDVSGVYLGEDRSSDYHFDQVIFPWWAGCLEHDKCSKTISGKKVDASAAPLPTRCIEVGQDTLKLTITAEQEGTYITLSHRWPSTADHSYTTVDNIEERLIELSFDALSKTFQDAVRVTRRLGICYLWIDSLCIIQDGDEGQDFRNEALQMSQYYQNAVMTIAAANVDPAHGFLHPQTTRLEYPMVRLPYIDPRGIQSGFFYVHRRRGIHGASSDYAQYVLEGKLLKRGWVLQEWLLSRRILHYTEDQVFFECQSREPFNDFGEVVRPEDLALIRINKRAAAGQQQYSLSSFFTEAELSPRDVWYRIVQIYSGSELSRPGSDRILALAGLAKELRQIMEDAAKARRDSEIQLQYVAGWWLEYIHMGLLWEQRDLGPRVQSRCGAPSWSWAAWLNPVHFRRPEAKMRDECEVKGVVSKLEFLGRTPAASPTANVEKYDVDNNFACLILSAKYRLLLVGDKLGDADCSALATHTGVRKELMSRWRSVADPARPNEHIGWADIGPCTTTSSSVRSSPRDVVLAIHVSTHESVDGGIEYGYLGAFHEVYCVLFITPCDASGQGITYRYNRLGVGRIFKKKFFQDAEEMDVELA